MELTRRPSTAALDRAVHALKLAEGARNVRTTRRRRRALEALAEARTDLAAVCLTPMPAETVGTNRSDARIEALAQRLIDATDQLKETPA